MPTKTELLRALPPFKNNYIIRVDDQDTKDIVKWLLIVTPKYAQDYDCIYKFFDTGDVYETCKGLWRFLKYSFTYDAESIDDQSVRSPAAILELDHIDCKHYSLFVAGVLAAILRHHNDPFKWCYRLASYNGDVTPGHVFVVVKDDQGDIWVDPVLAHFDERKQPSYYFDKKPKNMALYEISGIGKAAISNNNPVVSVNTGLAFTNANVLVNMNFASLKQLLLSDSSVLYGPVKRIYESNGQDFNALLSVLGINN